MGKTSTDSKRKYNEKAYDRIALTVKKGMKEVYQTKAAEEGLSLNALINKLLEEYMKNPLINRQGISCHIVTPSSYL